MERAGEDNAEHKALEFMEKLEKIYYDRTAKMGIRSV